MSESRIGTKLGKHKKFSNYRCVKCHYYLVPCTEEKMDLFEFTPKQKEKIRQHGLTHFCPNCMTGYQREEKSVSEESANCPFCGEELSFLRYEGEITNILYCENCKQGFVAEKEELKKIQKYAEKTGQPLSKQTRKAMEEVE